MVYMLILDSWLVWRAVLWDRRLPTSHGDVLQWEQVVISACLFPHTLKNAGVLSCLVCVASALAGNICLAYEEEDNFRQESGTGRNPKLLSCRQTDSVSSTQFSWQPLQHMQTLRKGMPVRACTHTQFLHPLPRETHDIYFMPLF